jgi:tRNA threonylcarbamoyladenosine biosynthesis protein TsaB
VALILNIDTATEKASICVSKNGQILAQLQNGQQREHASFVHTAIQQTLKNLGFSLSDMEAFAVTSGPGSYTGLRVGMATAKGFCYALSKPMIAINTLEVMTYAAIHTLENISEKTLFCPMIDARRMEVFAAIYNIRLQNVVPPGSVILDEHTFSNYAPEQEIVFFGNGSAKFKQLQAPRNSRFEDVEHDASFLAPLAERAFLEENFADVYYDQPAYLKNFHSF